MTSVATAISSRLEARFAAELEEVDGATLVRRCADVEELLTAAEAGAATVAAISPDFPGMSGGVVAELTLRGAVVLGVTSPTSPTDARQCEAWALTHTHVVGSGELLRVVRALERHPSLTAAGGGGEPRFEEDAPAPGGAKLDVSEPVSDPALPASPGPAQVIVVWGPPGSPGRTTTAAHLAHVLSRDGATVLIDADTVAPSCAALLGVLDEAPGVLAASRLVDAGTLNPAQLRALVAPVSEGFDVLTGIGRASRWHELTRYHLGAVLETARASYRWIVVDIAADISEDESLLYDTVAPARSGASLEALEQCDILLGLAAADPVSLQRFVLEWPDLATRHPDARVIVTKARACAVGGDPADVVEKALGRFAGLEVLTLLPDARDHLDAALLHGKLLTDTAPQGEYARVITALGGLLGADLVDAARGRSRLRSWRRR